MRAGWPSPVPPAPAPPRLGRGPCGAPRACRLADDQLSGCRQEAALSEAGRLHQRIEAPPPALPPSQNGRIQQSEEREWSSAMSKCRTGTCQNPCTPPSPEKCPLCARNRAGPWKSKGEVLGVPSFLRCRGIADSAPGRVHSAQYFIYATTGDKHYYYYYLYLGENRHTDR